MKIKAIEFADISFTTENLSLPKAKKVLSSNICKSRYCQRIVSYKLSMSYCWCICLTKNVNKKVLNQGMRPMFLMIVSFIAFFCFFFFFCNWREVFFFFFSKASLVAHMVNNLPLRQETWVWSWDMGDPLEKEMAAHSSILA